MSGYAARMRERSKQISSLGEWGFSNSEIRAFLNVLYAMSCEHPRRALRYAFAFIDQALLDERYAICDAVLDVVESNRLDVTTATGVLAITLQAKPHLKNRRAYYARVEAWLRKESPTEVEALLEGLE